MFKGERAFGLTHSALRPAPRSLRRTGLSCPASTDIATNSFYNSTLSGLPMAGQCLPGYSASITPPSRVCQLTGVWSSVTGNCGRTSRHGARGGLRERGQGWGWLLGALFPLPF